MNKVLYYEILISTLLIILIIVIFELIFFFVIIMPKTEHSIKSQINSSPGININLLELLSKNLTVDQLKNNLATVLFVQLNTGLIQRFVKLGDNIKEYNENFKKRRSKILGILMGCLVVSILLTAILSFVLRKYIDWKKMIFFLTTALFITGIGEVYFYYGIFTKLKSVNEARLLNGLITALRKYLSP
jgi:hypothetical protein